MKRVHVIDAQSLGTSNSTKSISTDHLDNTTTSKTPLLAWQPTHEHQLAVVAPTSYALRIYNKHADLIDIVNLTSICNVLSWSGNGELLAIGQGGHGGLVLWNAIDRCDLVVQVSSTTANAIRNITCIAWNFDSRSVACGTAKGNLLIYDLSNKTSIPIVGKHDRIITNLLWTQTNQIICISDDKSISISTPEGDTAFAIPLKSIPKLLQVGQIALEETSNPKSKNGQLEQVLVTTLDEGKSLYIHSITNPSTTVPIQLSLQPKFGSIIDFCLFNLSQNQKYSTGSSQQLTSTAQSIIKADAIVVACSQGYVVILSVSGKSIGMELNGIRPFKLGFSAVNIHPKNQSLPTSISMAHQGIVKVLDFQSQTDLSTESLQISSTFPISPDANISTPCDIGQLAWSHDRRFLSVCHKGDVITFAASVSSISTNNGEIMAIVSGLAHVTVGNHQIDIGHEPQSIALGQSHLAVAFNETSIKLYQIKEYQPVHTLTVPSKVTSMEIHTRHLYIQTVNEVVIISLDLFKQSLWPAPFPTIISAKHPDLVFTATGSIITCYTPPNTKCTHCDIGGPIKQLVSSASAPWVIACSSGTSPGAVFVNLASTTVVDIPKGLGNQYLLDTRIPGIAYTWREHGHANQADSELQVLTMLAYVPQTLHGQPTVVAVCEVPIPNGYTPVFASYGIISCTQTTSPGQLVTFPASDGSLISHYYLGEMPKVFQGIIKLRGTPGRANTLAEMTKNQISELIDAAISCLDLKNVGYFFHMIDDHASGMYFQESALDEELNILRGHVFVHLGDFNSAQERYLASRSPELALDLRKDLRQWEQALSLAAKIMPEQEPVIAKLYATSLEADGRFADALHMYNKASESFLHKSIDTLSEHERECLFGVALMRLRVGDLKAIHTIVQYNNMNLMEKAGLILEDMQEWTEAAIMLERAGQWARAASNFMKAKNMKRLELIMPKVSTSSIISNYGVLLESNGLVEQALKAYLRSQDVTRAVRILLEISRIDEAVSLVRTSRSATAAKLVADFFISIGDKEAVIEFYMLAGMRSEALQRSRNDGILCKYMDLIHDSATDEEYICAAVYYEDRKDRLQAGTYYMKAKHYEPAVAHFLRVCSGTQYNQEQQKSALELAIQCVGFAKSDALTNEVVAHMMSGKTVHQDPRSIFRLYLSLGQIHEASGTALIICQDEWSAGNYRVARDILWETSLELHKSNVHVPAQLRFMLMLLHSYMLAKILIRNNDHLAGARMLIRVSNNISRFPSHTVPILTSTVLECMRVGYKASANTFATMLMRPEHRPKIDPKYKNKIEALVRKYQDSDTDPVEEMQPCPYCNVDLGVTQVDCHACKNNVPICVASGLHMTTSGWSQCPHCLAFGHIEKMHAIALSKTAECPMCSTPWTVDLLTPILNYHHALSQWSDKIEFN